MSHIPNLHVVAGVIPNDAQHILLTQRLPSRPHGGLWEFPGGKVEAGESARVALARELQEELGIHVAAARPLIQVPHRYADLALTLDVWQVERYTGVPVGREGQNLAWVRPEDLPHYEYPAANLPVVTAARLPAQYVISPDPHDTLAWMSGLERTLGAGARLIQFRAHGLDDFRYAALAAQVVQRARCTGAAVLLNRHPDLVIQTQAAGVHLTRRALRACATRPLPSSYWVAASCHDAQDIVHAQAINVDFMVLGPVLPTASHPGQPALGWAAFQRWVASATRPVFALGGMSAAQCATAWNHGAQGVAGIRAFWR